MTLPTDKSVTAPLEPIPITIIGAANAPIPAGVMAITPNAHEPNFIINVVGPVQAIAIRFVNAYLVQLGGLLTAAMTPVGGKLLYTSDFVHMLALCGSLAFPGAALGLVKDLITVFGKLEAGHPLATGSV